MAEIAIKPGASDALVVDYLYNYLKERMRMTKGPVAITVPGGATPFPILQQLVTRNLDWDRLVVWPGDDRLVPEEHEASNTGKIRALFEPLGSKVVRLAEAGEVPRFALAWLGMGADGHIASLFPNTDPQADDPQAIRQLTPDPLPPEAPFDRITLTIPSLLNSDALLFVIRGDQKLEVFEAASRGENDLPIARLLGAARRPTVTCFA